MLTHAKCTRALACVGVAVLCSAARHHPQYLPPQVHSHVHAHANVHALYCARPHFTSPPQHLSAHSHVHAMSICMPMSMFIYHVHPPCPCTMSICMYTCPCSCTCTLACSRALFTSLPTPLTRTLSPRIGTPPRPLQVGDNNCVLNMLFCVASGMLVCLLLLFKLVPILVRASQVLTLHTSSACLPFFHS